MASPPATTQFPTFAQVVEHHRTKAAYSPKHLEKLKTILYARFDGVAASLSWTEVFPDYKYVHNDTRVALDSLRQALPPGEWTVTVKNSGDVFFTVVFSAGTKYADDGEK